MNTLSLDVTFTSGNSAGATKSLAAGISGRANGADGDLHRLAAKGIVSLQEQVDAPRKGTLTFDPDAFDALVADALPAPTPPTPAPAWTPYTPTTTNLTAVSSISRARQTVEDGKTAYVSIEITGTSNGSVPTISLPFTPLNTNQTFACTLTTGGATISGCVRIVGSTVVVGVYNNSAFGAAQVYIIRVQGVYETT